MFKAVNCSLLARFRQDFCRPGCGAVSVPCSAPVTWAVAVLSLGLGLCAGQGSAWGGGRTRPGPGAHAEQGNLKVLKVLQLSLPWHSCPGAGKGAQAGPGVCRGRALARGAEILPESREPPGPQPSQGMFVLLLQHRLTAPRTPQPRIIEYSSPANSINSVSLVRKSKIIAVISFENPKSITTSLSSLCAFTEDSLPAP